MLMLQTANCDAGEDSSVVRIMTAIVSQRRVTEKDGGRTFAATALGGKSKKSEQVFSQSRV